MLVADRVEHLTKKFEDHSNALIDAIKTLQPAVLPPIQPISYQPSPINQPPITQNALNSNGSAVELG